MPKALVQNIDMPKSMAEFAQLQAPLPEPLKQTWLHIKVKRMWWGISRVLWKTKDPLRYMCAVAELVIRTKCDETTHKPGQTVFTAHNADSLTRGFATLIDMMSKDREFRNVPILTIGREMDVATFLLSEGVYLNAAAHMNLHAVCIWTLGRFALVDPKGLPDQSALFNHNQVVSQCETWTKYLESILRVRLSEA